MYRIWYAVFVTKKWKLPSGDHAQSAKTEKQGKRIPAIFYRTEAGGEPVREWLKDLSPDDRKRIGQDSRP
jgi:hypothetical protein